MRNDTIINILIEDSSDSLSASSVFFPRIESAVAGARLDRDVITWPWFSPLFPGFNNGHQQVAGSRSSDSSR